MENAVSVLRIDVDTGNAARDTRALASALNKLNAIDLTEFNTNVMDLQTTLREGFSLNNIASSVAGTRSLTASIRVLAREISTLNSNSRVTDALDRYNRGAMSATQSTVMLASATRRASGGVSGLGRILGGFAGIAAVVSFGRAVGRTARALDNIRLAIASGATAAVGANATFGRLREIADRTGLSFTQLGRSFQPIVANLQALGISTTEATNLFEGLAVSIRNVGGTSRDIEAISLTINRIFSSGRLTGRDIATLSTSLPGFRSQLQTAAGLDSNAQLTSAIRSGSIDVGTFATALENNRRAPLSEEAENSLNARLNRVGNSFTNLADVISTLALDTVVSSALDVFTGAINSASSAIGTLARVGSSVRAFFFDTEENNRATENLRARNASVNVLSARLNASQGGRGTSSTALADSNTQGLADLQRFLNDPNNSRGISALLALVNPNAREQALIARINIARTAVGQADVNANNISNVASARAFVGNIRPSRGLDPLRQGFARAQEGSTSTLLTDRIGTQAIRQFISDNNTALARGTGTINANTTEVQRILSGAGLTPATGGTELALSLRNLNDGGNVTTSDIVDALANINDTIGSSSTLTNEELARITLLTNSSVDTQRTNNDLIEVQTQAFSSLNITGFLETLNTTLGRVENPLLLLVPAIAGLNRSIANSLSRGARGLISEFFSQDTPLGRLATEFTSTVSDSAVSAVTSYLVTRGTEFLADLFGFDTATAATTANTASNTGNTGAVVTLTGAITGLTTVITSALGISGANNTVNLTNSQNAATAQSTAASTIQEIMQQAASASVNDQTVREIIQEAAQNSSNGSTAGTPPGTAGGVSAGVAAAGAAAAAALAQRAREQEAQTIQENRARQQAPVSNPNLFEQAVGFIGGLFGNTPISLGNNGASIGQSTIGPSSPAADRFSNLPSNEPLTATDILERFDPTNFDPAAGNPNVSRMSDDSGISQSIRDAFREGISNLMQNVPEYRITLRNEDGINGRIINDPNSQLASTIAVS